MMRFKAGIPALGVIFRPTAVWDAVREANPTWLSSLVGHALPLALLPSLAWPLGQAFEGVLPNGQPWSPGYAAAAFVAIVAMSMATLLLFALGLYLPAPMFGVRRNWDRSMAVAAYASAPVFVSGVLLVFPILALVSMVALLHFFVLCYLGLQRVLDCIESESAMYVACASMFAGVSSMLLGGLCSATGLVEFAFH